MLTKGRNINEVLPDMMSKLLSSKAVGSRNGGTQERTFQHITLTHPTEREILLGSRKHNLAAQIAETVWVLSGQNDVEFLSRYLPRAADFSDDGERWRAGYGARLRNWAHHDEQTGPTQIDQLAAVYEILKDDIDSRRAVMSIWDPAIDFQPGKDIPCNDWLSFLHRDGKLSLQVGVRSNDAMWGWSGINAFEWSTLLEVMAGLLDVGVGELHFSITSLHLYSRHFGRARSIAADNVSQWSLTGERFDLGAVPGSFRDEVVKLNMLLEQWMSAEQMIREDAPNFETYMNAFPEPMLRSWLKVIAWWWTGDERYLDELGETSRLRVSALAGIQPPARTRHDEFIAHVDALHQEKHAAYGDSWKRRGEFVAIQANIARKVDRLGTGISTKDETQTDTAIDLLVYLCKYRWWLADQGKAPVPEGVSGVVHWQQSGFDYSDQTEPILGLLQTLPAKVRENRTEFVVNDELTFVIQQEFERLLESNDNGPAKVGHVDLMIRAAFVLAYRRWSA